MEIALILIMLVGLLTYVLSGNAKLSEIGRIAFFAALLAFLFGSSPHLPRLR